MERVGIYVRISDDPDGTQTATARQAEDCRKYAASHAWEVIDIFEDVDISAYQRTARRPEFERLLAAVRDKQVDGVLAWKMDRLSRRMRDFVRLDEQCEEAGGFIASVVEGIDTRQSAGRFVAELLTAQARMESANTSTRVTRAHEAMAKQGRPSLGGWRCFGYVRDLKAIIPKEAELIREAAGRVLAAEGIRTICLDWERRGIRSPAGNAFKQTPLRRLLMSPTVAGYRSYNGTVTQGSWPAILTLEEVTRLQAILRDPSRRTKRDPRRYLLSGGLLRCGRCGNPMVARPRNKVRRYVCARQPGIDNCGKMARQAEPVEDVVKKFVIAALDGADLTQYMYRQSDGNEGVLIEEIRRDEEALQQLSRDHYADAVISRTEFFAARDALQERLTRNRTRLGNHRQFAVLASVASAGKAIEQQWEQRPLEWRRGLISAILDHVVIHPAVKGRRAFDPSLVEPVWRF
jgi:DNA invertase Pin-like site-specific DNA recombinase